MLWYCWKCRKNTERKKKNKEIIQKFKEAGDSRYTYQIELDEKDKTFNIAKNSKYDRY